LHLDLLATFFGAALAGPAATFFGEAIRGG
jgi:hypothetical protein